MFQATNNDFTPLNKAVALEASRVKQIVGARNLDARSRATKRHARAFLFICLGVGALTFLLLLSYYFYAKAGSAPTFTGRASDAERSLTSSELRTLDVAIQTAPAEVDSLPTQKVYTAFFTVPVASGGEVVTGWRYRAGHWEEPFGQYCYLQEIRGDLITRVDLATVDEGWSEARIVVSPKDKLLTSYAQKHCRFF